MTRASSAILMVLLICAASAYAQAPQPGNAKQLATEEILVHPGADWSAIVTAPQVDDEVLVLDLQARLHVPGGAGGGCNWVLRVFIDDEPLAETLGHPRLLNKAPFFDFAEGKYHFSWFNRNWNAWMMMFADNYDTDSAKTGQDSRFLFDISDYVRPGQEFRLRLQYAQPNLPSVLKQEAPLAVRAVTVGTLPAGTVSQLREQAIAGDTERRAIEIRTQVDAEEPVGEPPYEITRAGRVETPPAQVALEDLSGWKATAYGDAEITIAASRAERIWREQTARIEVAPCDRLMLELSPPQPVPIPSETTAVNCWITSDHAWTDNTPVEVMVTIVDSRGRRRDLDCGPLRGKYWEMRQGILGAGTGRLEPPLYFGSIALTSGKLKVPVTMHLESLAFFKRERVPYAKLEMPEGVVFPTTPDNMLPPAPADCSQALEAGPGKDEHTFTSSSAGGDLTFTISPASGGLSDITARFADGPVFHPCALAGIVLDTPDGPVTSNAANTRLIDARREGDTLVTAWQLQADDVRADYEVRYALKGRTLIADITCPGGRATALDMGKVSGLADAAGIEIPYLVFRILPAPRIAMGSGVFVSVLPDWYHSNSSIIDTSTAAAEPDVDGLRIAGRTTYGKLTNGKRNDLAERLLITVSPDIHDTLPSIAAPRSDKIEHLAPSMYVMSSMFTPEYYRTLKRYGLDHVIAIHFAGIWWRRVGEGFAMRYLPRPDMTEEQVKQYRSDIRSLGYDWGMLVNYTCYATFNQYWDENRTALTPDGRLSDGWFGHYWTKPNAMAGLAREVGEQIRKRYPTDCVYLDVHTNLGAAALDYEAGVDGAGTGRANIMGNAASIAEVHNQQGALCSEGICRWFYAGLADMDYAQWVGTPKPNSKPLLPDFDLLRIHPRQIGTAMGYGPTCFFDDDALAEYYKDPGTGTGHVPFYQYVAATLAHGHSAMIGYGYHPALSRTISYYALLSGPQEDYLPDTLSDISWWSDEEGRYVSTSQALLSGVREDGKLRVTYSGGQVIHVNYHPDKQWKLEAGGREFTLPPYGWMIAKPGEIFGYSALMDGRRVDFIDCPRYVYMNSGDKPATEAGITVDGAVFIKKGTEATVIPCGNLGSWKNMPCEPYPMFTDRVLAGPPADRGVRSLRINLRELPGFKGQAPVRVLQRDERGHTVESETVTGTTVSLSPTSEIADYLLTR